MKSSLTGIRNTKVRYILTWVSLAVILICGVLLLAVSWNRSIASPSPPVLMFILWLGISAAGIYLFMLAVKKAHRQLVDEERSQKGPAPEGMGRLAGTKQMEKESQALDFSSTARKLVRRTQDNVKLEDLGKSLLKNLANELEIMSGVFYLRKRGGYEATATYALSSHSEPYTFKEGEGLTGQVARNQQLIVLTSLPENYLEVYSGLGKAKPSYLAIVPLVQRNKTLAVLECAGFKYDPHDIENMFRILARDLMEKTAQNLT